MNIRGREVKIDKKILAKAVGIMCLSWLALPIVYYMLLGGEDGKEEEEDGKEESREKTD